MGILNSFAQASEGFWVRHCLPYCIRALQRSTRLRTTFNGRLRDQDLTYKARTQTLGALWIGHYLDRPIYTKDATTSRGPFTRRRLRRRRREGRRRNEGARPPGRGNPGAAWRRHKGVRVPPSAISLCMLISGITAPHVSFLVPVLHSRFVLTTHPSYPAVETDDSRNCKRRPRI